MFLRRWAQLIVCATLALIVLGGVVHSRGASLACPDWPLCFGMVFPPMEGGVLLEHSHRLLASGVGLAVLVLLVAVWKQLRERRLVAIGLALVVGQGLLGGATVYFRLPPPISIAHLGTSMIFLAWAVLTCQRLDPHAQAQAAHEAPSFALRQKTGWALSAVYLQLIIGATLRHTHASLSCGTEALSCQGGLLPVTGPQILQTFHRVLAIVALGVVVMWTLPTLRWAKRRGQTAVRRFVVAAHALVFLQIIMGVLALKTGLHVHVVVTHLALAALLWADLVALWGRLSLLSSAQEPSQPAPQLV